MEGGSMYSIIINSDNEKGMIKSSGPFRFHSSGNSAGSIQSSGVCGVVGTYEYPFPTVNATPPAPIEIGEGLSHDEKAALRKLTNRHKRALELLAHA